MVDAAGSNAETGAHALPEHAAGELLGGIYRVRGLLSRGALARVYEADDQVLGRRVAIKVPSEPGATNVILAEAQALAALSHPGLPVVHAAGRHGELPFLVMERLVGTSLEQHLIQSYSSGCPLDLGEVLRVLIDVGEALGAIHQAGIAHRDVKPDNVLLCGERGTVLSDLGMVVSETDLADSGAVVHGGSPYYMAPEVSGHSTQKGGGRLADLYSFGVLAYELLTGSVPFHASDRATLERLHAEARIPDVRMLRPNLPSALAELIRELMAKEPGERPDTAEEVLWRLRAIAGQLPQRAGPYEPTAMIVCDDLGFATELRYRLEHWIKRVRVVVCHSGPAALAELERFTPRLLLLDLQLGGMGGMELVMRLRGADSPAPEAIVALSERAQPEDLEVLRRLEVMSVIPRGKTMGAMLEPVVRNVLACSDVSAIPSASRPSGGSRPVGPTRPPNVD